MEKQHTIKSKTRFTVVESKQENINKSAFFLSVKSHLNAIHQGVVNRKRFTEDALDNLIYGFNVKLIHKAKITKKNIFLCDNNMDQLVIQERYSSLPIRININQITSLVFNEQPFTYNSNTKNLIDMTLKNFLTLIVGKQNYNMVFASDYELNMFLDSIYNIKKNNLRLLSSIDDPTGAAHNYEIQSVLKVWYSYDTDHSGQIDKTEFKKFIDEISLQGYNNLTFDELYLAVDKDQSGFIDLVEFTEFFKSLLGGSIEVDKIFNSFLSIGRKYLTVDDIGRFFKEYQQEEVGMSELVEMIVKCNYNMDPAIKNSINRKLNMSRKGDSQADLSRMLNETYLLNLTSDETEALVLNLNHFKYMVYNKNYTNIMNYYCHVEEDQMNFPMNDYFINSSHNTYLSGHQLYGDSKVEMYAYALTSGYRLVELDCWDGPNDEPKITHGGTMTSDILFKDVLTVIKENAFLVSPYPVILSIEMHCSNKQQEVMTKYFKEILVDLYIVDPENPPNKYPSPEALKGKFIIKCGRTRIFKDKNQKYHENNQNDSDQDDDKINEAKEGNNNNNYYISRFQA